MGHNPERRERFVSGVRRAGGGGGAVSSMKENKLESKQLVHLSIMAISALSDCAAFFLFG